MQPGCPFINLPVDVIKAARMGNEKDASTAATWCLDLILGAGKFKLMSVPYSGIYEKSRLSHYVATPCVNRNNKYSPSRRPLAESEELCSLFLLIGFCGVKI